MAKIKGMFYTGTTHKDHRRLKGGARTIGNNLQNIEEFNKILTEMSLLTGIPIPSKVKERMDNGRPNAEVTDED